MQNVLQQHHEREAARPIYEFDLPPEVAELNDQYIKKSVGFMKLKASEELDAIDAAQKNVGKTSIEMVKRALVEVDGKKVDKANLMDDTIIEHTDPVIRQLLVAAYTDLSGNTDATVATFIKSRRVKVG